MKVKKRKGKDDSVNTYTMISTTGTIDDAERSSIHHLLPPPENARNYRYIYTCVCMCVYIHIEWKGFQGLVSEEEGVQGARGYHIIYI